MSNIRVISETVRKPLPQKWLFGLIGKMRAAAKRRAAISKLQNLSEDMLKDIGISRSEIVMAVDGHLHRNRGRDVVTAFATADSVQTDIDRKAA